MKNLIVLLSFAVVIQFCACKKDSTGTSASGLTGKWKEVGNLVSNGGPLYYVPAPVKTDYDYAQFSTDSNISGTVFNDYATYAIKDTATVVFTKSDKSTIQNYNYHIKGDSLKMSRPAPYFVLRAAL